MKETLTWGGMPHRFVITVGKHGLCGTLHIIKPKGSQRMSVRFPREVTLQMVLEAWEKQGKQWQNVVAPPCSPIQFFAVRAIDLGRWRILWYVLHENDKPYDACRVLEK